MLIDNYRKNFNDSQISILKKKLHICNIFQYKIAASNLKITEYVNVKDNMFMALC